MEKKLKCVAVNKNANGTATVVLHQSDEKGRVICALQLTTFNPAEVDEFTHQGEVQVVLTDLQAK